jgi:hypothetical protein
MDKSRKGKPLAIRFHDPKKTFHHKSRSGCRTCKARRVKVRSPQSHPYPVHITRNSTGGTYQKQISVLTSFHSATRDVQFVRTATAATDPAYTIHSIFTLQNPNDENQNLPKMLAWEHTGWDWTVIPVQILPYYPVSMALSANRYQSLNTVVCLSFSCSMFG